LFGGLLLFGPRTETRDLEVKSEPLAMHPELVNQLIKYNKKYGNLVDITTSLNFTANL